MANKVIKVTVEKLMAKLTKLRKETGFPMGMDIIDGAPQYKVILTFGANGEMKLFGQALTTREAAMAIDMFRLVRQMNWHFEQTPPLVSRIIEGKTIKLNENRINAPIL